LILRLVKIPERPDDLLCDDEEAALLMI